MRTVIVSFDTPAQSFPGIVVPGLFRVSILSTGPDPSPVPDQDVAAGPVQFDLVPPGDYVARVVRLNSDGSDLGTPQLAAFNVPADTTMVAVAGVVTVVVSDGVPV